MQLRVHVPIKPAMFQPGHLARIALDEERSMVHAGILIDSFAIFHFAIDGVFAFKAHYANER